MALEVKMDARKRRGGEANGTPERLPSLRSVRSAAARAPGRRPLLLLLGVAVLAAMAACEGKSSGPPPAAFNPGPPIRKAFIVSLESANDAITQYQVDNGQIPQGEGMEVLLKAGIRSIPSVDPWGGKVRYEGRGNNYTLSSAGPDRRWGTQDDVVVKNGHLVANPP